MSATEIPSPASNRDDRAIRVLAAATLATVGGMLVAALRGDGTAINSFLFLTAELSHVGAARVEAVAVVAVVALAFAALFRPHWLLVLPAGVLAFAEALARVHEGGKGYSELALGAHAARYLAPLALAAVLLLRRNATATRGGRVTAAWMLRVALAAVFAFHGLEALGGHAEFIDLILSSAVNLGGIRISESDARQGLEIIGVVDMGVAAAVLLRPHAVVLAWVAFWGALTAFSRMTAYGWPAYPEVLIRSSHFLAPAAVWLLEGRAPARAPQASPAESPGASPVVSPP